MTSCPDCEGRGFEESEGATLECRTCHGRGRLNDEQLEEWRDA